MKGKIGTPQRMLFTIFPGNWSFRAFIENGSIKLSIDTSSAEHYSSGNNGWALIWDIDQTGSGIADA